MPLRYMQQEAVDSIFDYWSKEPGNPLVDMATGTGKSMTMTGLNIRLVGNYPSIRVMNVTHVVELVEGNYQELVREWPFAPAGIYAASLGRRDHRAQILYAQLQTVWNKAEEIGHVDVLEIDEAHLVPASASTMYGKLIAALRAINPDMKVVGFTATPYRLDSGRLDEGDDRMFDAVVYEYGIRQGIADGYLTPLSSKGTITGFDLTGVGTVAGDYKKNALAAAVDKDEITRAAVAEAITLGADRRTALFFCSGVDHAHHVRDIVRGHGKSCEAVHGQTPTGERRGIIEAFRNGSLWGVTNDAILTTGTNIPGIDLIADLAPTKSTSRFVQKAGRGTRPVYAPGFDLSTTAGRLAAIAAGPKPNCLYLDYAKNIAYHGPVDMVQPKKPGKGDGESPIKLCPVDEGGCAEIVHISVMVCPCCGYEFPPSEEVKITASPSSAPVLSTDDPWQPVLGQIYAYHDKVGGTPSVRCEYTLDNKRVERTWICPEHTGFAKSKSDRYWRHHGGQMPFPDSVDEFLDRVEELNVTAQVKVKYGGRFNEVIEWLPGEGKVGAAPAGNLDVRPKRRPANDNYRAPANDNNYGRMVAFDIDDDIPFFMETR